MHPCCCLVVPASRGLGSYEWHPFSVSSAPDDEFVTLHIKAVGDWTNNLMALVKKAYEGHVKPSQVCVATHLCRGADLLLALGSTAVTRAIHVANLNIDTRRGTWPVLIS